MAPVNSAQLYRPSKRQRSWEFVRTFEVCPTSTMKEILYVKVNGCVGVFVFGFFGDGESYIVKKSLSKINPIYMYYNYNNISTVPTIYYMIIYATCYMLMLHLN